MRAQPTRKQRGATLVDLSVVVAVVGVLTSLALPTYQSQIAKGRRSDAIAALTRVQVAQEQFRAHHGSYALALPALHGAGSTLSPGGHYEIALLGAHGGGFIARAQSREAGTHESGCSELTVNVSDGMAVFGPSARCWNR